MATFRARKVVSALPTPLEPDTLYAVRVGEGFDLYISDNTGTLAHKVNGGGGSTAWTEIASATPTGVSSVDFTGLLATAYNELEVRIEGVSHNNGTSTNMTVAVSPDGSTFSTTTSLTVGVANTVQWWGARQYLSFRGDGGFAVGGPADLASSPAQASAGAVTAWRCDGGIDALRIAITAGNFDAGTIRLMGR